MSFHKKGNIYKRIVLTLILVASLMSATNYAVGPGETKDKKIAVVGDSYAWHFLSNEGTELFEYFIFPVGTVHNDFNKSVFEKAIISHTNYILFSTGVNDQALNTSLDVFENTLREYIAKAKAFGKQLILHTYMNYPAHKNGSGAYSPREYDAIFRKLVAEFDNVHYIDMSSFSDERYVLDDNMHFNKFFYDTLKAKLIYITDSLDAHLYKSYTDWMKVSNSMQIAVTGDSYASNFCVFENHKDYTLLDFSQNTRNLIQNNSYIKSAIDSTAENVLLSIGINDYEDQVDLVEFEETVKIYFNQACYNHKKVFVHSYMNYPNKKIWFKSPGEYDKILKKVADEYPNVCYVDMKNYSSSEYLMPDEKHYNIAFYDMLYAAIKMVLGHTS